MSDYHWVEGYGGHIYERRDWLRMLHKASGLFYREVAERVGVSVTGVYVWMSGKYDDPTFDTLNRYASVYGEGIWAAYGYTPAGWLLHGRARTSIEYAPPPVEVAPPLPPCVVCGRTLPNLLGARKTCGDFCSRVLGSERAVKSYRLHRETRLARQREYKARVRQAVPA